LFILSILGSFQFDLEMNINIFVCTVLLEKITGGPSGPLAIICFSKKADTHKHTAKNLVQDVEDLFPVLKAPTLLNPRS
jgi:hypothetical protein